MAQPIKKTLVIGQFQAGKTSGQVKRAYERQQKNSNLVSVFIAYGQNTNKENQERHIRKIYGKNLNLITTSEDLKAFKIQAQKSKLSKTRYTVISLLGNHHQLETLQNILTTKSPFHYVIWVDESDTFSKDFDYQPVETRKDNLINSIDKLEYHQVDEIIYVTATPFTELVSATTFSECIPCTIGKNYIGLDEIKNSMETVSLEDVDAFSFGYTSDTLEDFFIEQNKVKNSVTIISTRSGMKIHKRQCEAICDFLQDPDTLVVEFNSNQGQKYFSYPNNPIIPKKHNNKNQLNEMFEVAENYSKLFIVGHQTLDRSVTLKSDKYSSYSGMLFSSGRDVALSGFLQRLARICGYQKYVPLLLTDKSSKVTLAEYDFQQYVDICKNNLDAKNRRTALLELTKSQVNFTNVFGNYRNNGIKPKGAIHSTPVVTYINKNEFSYPVITKCKSFADSEIPSEALNQLKEKRKAGKNTPLYNFIMEQFLVVVKILEAVGADGKSHIAYQLPNRDRDLDNFRDTLYLYRGNKLTISNQPYARVNKSFALFDISSNEYKAYNNKSAFKRL